MVSGHRSAHGRRRQRRKLRKRIAIAAGSLLVIAALAALIIQPPAFLRSALDSPTPAASPSRTTQAPVPTPASTPTLGSLTDVEEKLQARIAVSGDTGTRNAAQRRVAQRMAVEAKKEPYDAFIISGDLVYPDGDASLTRRSVIDPYAPVLKDATLIPALGNHDVQSGEGMDILKRLGRDSAWYVEKIGPVRVIVLDSNRIGSAKQTAWLRRVLSEEQPRGTWTIAAMHHPAYSAGHHGSDKNVQRRWVPLFEQAGVELVVAGHDHDYQRSSEIDGITYIVSGGGAKVRESGRESFTATSVGALHYVDLFVYEDRLEGRAIRHDGGIIDTFTIKRWHHQALAPSSAELSSGLPDPTLPHVPVTVARRVLAGHDVERMIKLVHQGRGRQDGWELGCLEPLAGIFREVHAQRLGGDERIYVAVKQGGLDAIRVENRTPVPVGTVDLRHVPVAVLR